MGKYGVQSTNIVEDHNTVNNGPHGVVEISLIGAAQLGAVALSNLGKKNERSDHCDSTSIQNYVFLCTTDLRTYLERLNVTKKQG